MTIGKPSTKVRSVELTYFLKRSKLLLRKDGSKRVTVDKVPAAYCGCVDACGEYMI